MVTVSFVCYIYILYMPSYRNNVYSLYVYVSTWLAYHGNAIMRAVLYRLIMARIAHLWLIVNNNVPSVSIGKMIMMMKAMSLLWRSQAGGRRELLLTMLTNRAIFAYFFIHIVWRACCALGAMTRMPVSLAGSSKRMLLLAVLFMAKILSLPRTD